MVATVRSDQAYSFLTSPTVAGCWIGAPSAFEEKLLASLPLFPLEQLRRRFIYAATNTHEPVQSARAILQMAFDTEIGVSLEKVISFPPDALTSNVCPRRRFLEIDADLQQFSFLIGPAVAAVESAAFLPQPYVDLLRIHLGSNYARYRVAAVSALLCFAAQYLVEG